MLPRGDGAGQHLCEGDLGYKTKQNKLFWPSYEVPTSYFFNLFHVHVLSYAYLSYTTY